MRIQRLKSRLFMGVLSLVLLAGLGPQAARAQSDIYRIDRIKADATAETTTEARTQALAAAHQDAFGRLLARIVPIDAIQTLPPLDAEQIANYVQDFSVANDRTSDVRYLADLTFQFDADGVRRYLRSQEVSFAEARGDPLLVLPVLGGQSSARLWREPNPWHRAWAGRDLAGELLPMILPLGDLEDVSAISAGDALAGAAERMDVLASRYGAQETLVAQALVTGDSNQGTARIEAVATRYSGYRLDSARLSFRQEEGETLGRLLARAVDGVVAEVQEAWKRDNLLQFGEQSTLMATVPVRSINEWLEVRKRLSRLPVVVRSDVAYLTRNAVDVRITYVGDEDQLARTLARSDLLLTPDLAQGWWELVLNAPLTPGGN